MATLSKKINMINSAGTQQTANLYSTTAESGSPYLSAMVDGTAAYAPLVSPSDASATSGRVALSDGTIYAIGKSAVPSYSYQLLTTAGSGTFTVPSGVSKLRVTCVGGGAGGTCIDNTGECPESTNCRVSRCAGGATTFGSVTANGATAPIFSICTRTGDCSRDGGCDIIYYLCSGYTVSKGTGNGGMTTGYDPVYGAGCVALTSYTGTQLACVGAGGYGDNGGNNVCMASSGGSGYKTVSMISVTAGDVISYTVGAGGLLNRWGTYWSYAINSNEGQGGSPGGAGGILVEWGQGIE